ncbi:MAG: rRNA pseudouridine synthase [Calditrichaceae bacterium]|nr:rRNA pseudouridine synthase [Calditrichaceae bacterium]
MRLNKYLAHAGVASRRKCDDLIQAGYIKVNGKKVNTLGVLIDELKDEITFKDQKVTLGEEQIYILLNKPQGVVTTASDEFMRTTVLDLLAIPERVFPVGRLDYDTTGVLLLTNDGELTNRLLHPGYESEKIYRVLIDKIIRPIDLHKLQKGIMLDGKMTLPCKIKEIRRMDNRSFLEITLREGRNRQIRRMFEEFGYVVEELNRVSFSGLTLGSLRPGEWRYLTQDEINRLKERVQDEY